ncbi:arf-GAP domain and FG repeat-containing protein 1-like isoform X2 [Homarus americanus]|uniref:arf-GAP domain and FG repeat-containing protein 1-like isoform X2 n=1 Tax=Homarus americanus TaxID=6706 RepID=UPI001C462F77|nr:arf-GAP domain and FG repeat-containing protein 1-like isoform X2 [Homarus americanus]
MVDPPNMASSRRKQDEKNLKTLRELGSQPSNRICFDCHQKGTTYINMTVGSFVCTSCSGILRGLNPPHRVKSISMASFTQEEIEQIKSKGNQYCGAVWLGLYDAKISPFPDTKDEHKIRDFMIMKYEKKRFYIEPSIAVKNMPPQNSSATSSNASTPSSETSKAGPTANTSVSRPNVSASQSSGSVSGGLTSATNTASKNSTPKSSASLDLLADLGNQSGSTVNSNDPFASPTSSKAPTSVSQPSFANFENANIFTNTPSSTSSNKSTPLGPHLPFSTSPLTPMAPGSSSNPPPASVPNTQSSSNPPVQDRYAALKDLDEEFKTQKESETVSSNDGGSWPIPNGSHQNSSVFRSPSSTMNGSVFGSPGTSNNVFGTVNGGGSGGIGVFGTPPNAGNAWANFTGANPFSGCNNGAPWMNGGGSLATTHTQQGFGSVVQPNPFGTTPDPNFNQFGNNAPINGTSSANNGAWANFNQHPQNTKMQWMTSNGTANPFMATPQMPSSGSSYNPFL